MSFDEKVIKESIASTMASTPLKPLDVDAIWRRGIRRRYTRLLGLGTVGTMAIIGIGLVYATIPSGDGRFLSPFAGRGLTTCSPAQIYAVDVDMGPPRGTGFAHTGTYFKATVTSHDPSCTPTLYVEVDGDAALPPDGQGKDAAEFRDADARGNRGNACVIGNSIDGSFLYSGKHIIGLGYGCDPKSIVGHATQETYVFGE